ncbi:MAG: Ig-like domain-containing protein [Pseudomonadota bacterium]
MDGTKKSNAGMFAHKKVLSRLAVSLLAIAATNLTFATPVDEDHREFEATLHAPYAGNDARTFTLDFSYPFVQQAQDVSWRLELVDAAGRVLQSWNGAQRLFKDPVSVKVQWDGKANGVRLSDGVYTMRLQAVPHGASLDRHNQADAASVDAALAAGGELEGQSWEILVGSTPAPSMPQFAPLATNASRQAARQGQNVGGGSTSRESLAVSATAALPYTIYYGNMHSQTNHSDGGGALSSCTGAQNPQSGTAGGPTEAYTYAMNKGLDFLLASEHNHMFDGSDSTNASADATVAHNLFQSGLSAAATFNAAHSNFLGVYGLEWGVISNGGHMNILNTTELLGWESNSSGQLIGDTFTAKNDYAGLFTLMAQRGWVGQFNHPSTSGQFLVNGVPFGYSAAGDTAMALCEVLNTSAFSTNTTESETSRSTYEGACNKALESGYHLAFTTDQDNHCANWGASYTNRTGVLIPTGQAFNSANFIAAVKARRVFATMDKTSQVVFTANGHVMGERFSNSGALNLAANFASTSGKTVSTANIYEGVPGRNGTVTVLASAATASITPSVGEHFYYAKLTQNDGNILWSAPIWVTQTTGVVDTTAPTVSASETGSSGNISFNASASDNVGVTLVEFYVDNALKASTNTAPYTASFNSNNLVNGSHSLVAKAYDAANNVGTSSAASFSVNNVFVDTVAPTTTASESGNSGTITLSATASDNVGVTKVEFYIDNVLRGSSTTAPYSMAFNSAAITNATHSLTTKAYDAAGNVGTSSGVSFAVNNVIVDGSAPIVSASESGGSGTITLSATASDNVGVTKVEFYVDNVLKGSSTTSPYALALNSTTLSNASHSLTAKAYDAAGNVGSSSAVSFSVNNAAQQLIVNGGFESGTSSWTASSGVITNDATEAGHAGSYKAWLDGYGAAHTDTMYQTVTIPAAATSANLSFWLRVESDETTTTTAYDTLKVQVRNSSNAVLGTLATYSNLNKGTTFSQKSFDLSAYKGQTVRIYFEGVEGASVITSFIIDDVSLTVQ